MGKKKQDGYLVIAFAFALYSNMEIYGRNIDALSKNEAMKWLKDVGLSTTGTKEELIQKIHKFVRYPKLVRRLQEKATRLYKFPCSLDPTSIPQLSAKWSIDDSNYPRITQEEFFSYALQKKEGSQGQQEKAFRMLQSRKIVNVKTLRDESGQFVKAMIKKSYGNDSRPAVIYFYQHKPQKAHCVCPVGASGLCCHVLSLLLFLKHFTDTKEKILELTCTEKLQKWHRRISKGSIPMIPLKDINLKSASMKKNKQMAISAADSDKSYFKRNVSSIIQDLNAKLDLEKPVSEHVFTVLSQSEIGRKTSVGEHLCYTFKLHYLADHQYVSKEVFKSHVLGIDPLKVEQIKNSTGFQVEPEGTSLLSSVQDTECSKITVQQILEQNLFDIHIETPTTTYDIQNNSTQEICKAICKQKNFQSFNRNMWILHASSKQKIWCKS